MVETNFSNEKLQLLLEVYKETKKEYWLAVAAHMCLKFGMPLPASLRWYLIILTGDVIHAKGNRRKAQTRMRRDRYLETMRELIFLTGTTPEDAAERITQAVTIEDEDDDVRTEGTLMNWWNNRNIGQTLNANGLTAVDTVFDGCNENADGTDVWAADLYCNDVYCDSFVKFCDTPDPKVKIRFHLDIEELFWYQENYNEACLTTSDETIMYRPGRDKWTGPELMDGWLAGDTWYWKVSLEELGLAPGDYVAGWVDIHYKGIQDRAPNTDDADFCAKPQVYGEVLEIIADSPRGPKSA